AEGKGEGGGEYGRALALTEKVDVRAVSVAAIAESWNRQALAEAREGHNERAAALFVEALRTVPGYAGACRNLRSLAETIRIDPAELASCSTVTRQGGAAQN